MERVNWEETRSIPLPPPAFRHKDPKTHCKWGHPFSPENTYLDQSDPLRPIRVCLECRRRRGRATDARRRSARSGKR